ncbi:MAG: hypothetical protein R3E48_11835 [Burkholderiaceae bacterium]
MTDTLSRWLDGRLRFLCVERLWRLVLAIAAELFCSGLAGALAIDRAQALDDAFEADHAHPMMGRRDLL